MAVEQGLGAQALGTEILGKATCYMELPGIAREQPPPEGRKGVLLIMGFTF